MIRTIFTLTGDEFGARYRLVLALLALAGVLQGSCYVLVLPLIRSVFAGGDDTGGWTVALAATALAAVVADYVGQTTAFRVGCPMGRHLHHRLGDHTVGLPLGWFSGDRVGRLGRLVSNGVLDVMSSVAHTQRRLIVAVASPATVLVGSFLVEWRVGVLLVVVGPITYAVYRFTSRAGNTVDELMDATAVEAADRVVEYGRTQPVQRAYGRVDDRFAALDDAFDGQRRSLRSAMKLAVPAVVAFALSTQLVFVVGAVGGSALVLDGVVDVATLLGSVVLVLKFLEPLQYLGAIVVASRVEQGSATRIAEVLETAPLPEHGGADPAFDIDAPAVEFRAVDFGYGERADDRVLHDVSFSVARNSTLAIVGPSGSGKTTLARLVARFYDVDAGSVLVDGVDVRAQSSARLLATVSPMFQDVFLFRGTIEDNIRLARPDASAAEFAAAAEAARLDEVAARLPDGWATEVGEGGANLSGGERQRVSLTRALLKAAPVVILDEPTSSIDSENEAAITTALHQLTRERTVLVIAHRLRTIRDADKIIVLDGGRIVQTGTHDELVAEPGVYARFWQQRASAESWTLAGES